MKQVQKPRKPLIVYYLIAIAVLILFNSFVFPAIVGGNVEEVDYGTFLTMVENKEVSKVQLEGESIYFITPYGHVDIYCSSHSEALSFGLQYADVYQLN